MGSLRTYKEVINKMITNESWSLCFEFIFDIIILAIIMMAILIDKFSNEREDCNIPIR